MNETTHASLIVMASTPTTATTQSTMQQTGGASTGIPGWLSVDVPLLGALGVGAIIAASIGVWGNSSLEKQRQRHGKELEDQRQHFEKERDKVRRQHEIELEQVKADYESEREKERERKNGRKELMKAWETLLDDSRLGAWELTNHITYHNLEPFFSNQFRTRLHPFISYARQKNEGGMIEIDPYTTYSDTDDDLIDLVKKEILGDTNFRGLLKEELARLKKEWDLI